MKEQICQCRRDGRLRLHRIALGLRIAGPRRLGHGFRLREEHPRQQYRLRPTSPTSGSCKAMSLISAALEKALTPGVDTVFHLAAVVGVKNYLNDPLRVLDVNVIGTRNVLELSHRHGTRVVFASTSEVFGKNPNPPFAEDDDRVLGSTRTARWSYSTSKAMAEHLVFAMHAAYALPVTVVRYFNVYGPRQTPIFVISQTIHRILNGRQPLLYDSGDQTRCFTYVDDAIAGTLLAADSSAAIGEAFNIGSMTETTVRDAVDLAIKIANVDSVSERRSHRHCSALRGSL